jgi:hypothetical protein
LSAVAIYASQQPLSIPVLEALFSGVRGRLILRTPPVKLLVSPGEYTAPKVSSGRLVGTYAAESKR